MQKRMQDGAPRPPFLFFFFPNPWKEKADQLRVLADSGGGGASVYVIGWTGFCERKKKSCWKGIFFLPGLFCFCF